jgi:hypothetical protein
MVEAAVSSTWIHAENCVTFERNTSGQVGCSRWWYALLVSNRSIELSWRNTDITSKKTCVLEGRGFRPLIQWENWVSFSKKYSLQLRSFKVEIGSVWYKTPIQLTWINPRMCWRQNISLRIWSI